MTSFVFQHLAEIENLISIGVYQDAICQKLADRGMAMSIPAFRKALSRARQKHLKLAGPLHAGNLREIKAQIRDQVVSGRRLNPSEFEVLQRPAQAFADSRSESALSMGAKCN